MKRKEVRKKASNTRKERMKLDLIKKTRYWLGKKHTKEYKDKMSKSLSGKNNPMYGKTHYNSKRIFYKNIIFRSSWEVIVAKWLDKNNFSWQYEPQRFYFNDCSYLPDFYVKELNTYIEVKGRYSELDRKKVRLFKKYYSQFNFLFIDRRNLNEFK